MEVYFFGSVNPSIIFWVHEIQNYVLGLLIQFYSSVIPNNTVELIAYHITVFDVANYFLCLFAKQAKLCIAKLSVIRLEIMSNMINIFSNKKVKSCQYPNSN